VNGSKILLAGAAAFFAAFSVGPLSTVARADDSEAGRRLFNEGGVPPCAVCHILADAEAKGEVGPDLDDFKPTLEQLRAAVTTGIGVMPAYEESLSTDEIETVSRYVAAVAGTKQGAAAPADAAASGGVTDVAGDAKAGEAVFKKCRSCHSVDKGGPNRAGPSLFGIVGGPVAGVKTYKYSPALTAYGGEWTHERLTAFLAKPKAEVPKTKMSFAGLKKEKELADIIAYLATLHD
jgi:cytochrome c2